MRHHNRGIHINFISVCVCVCVCWHVSVWEAHLGVRGVGQDEVERDDLPPAQGEGVCVLLCWGPKRSQTRHVHFRPLLQEDMEDSTQTYKTVSNVTRDRYNVHTVLTLYGQPRSQALLILRTQICFSHII